MNNEIRGSEFSDISAKRFRKSFKTIKKTTEATFNEFWKAIDTGSKDIIQEDLSPRKLKDIANVVTNWIEKNHNITALDVKEQKEFKKLIKLVHDIFEDYKWAKRMWVQDLYTKKQAVKDAIQQYLRWAQSIEERAVQYKTKKINEIDKKINKNYKNIEEERRIVVKSICNLYKSNSEQLASEIIHNIKDLRKESKKLIESLLEVCSYKDIKRSMNVIKVQIEKGKIVEEEDKKSFYLTKKLLDKINKINTYYETYGKLLEKLIREREGYFNLKSDLENRAMEKA